MTIEFGSKIHSANNTKISVHKSEYNPTDKKTEKTKIVRDDTVCQAYQVVPHKTNYT